MDTVDSDFIVTSHPAKRRGISLPRHLYEQLSDFIVKKLTNDERHTSLSLLEKADESFPGIPNLYWYLIHVRLDLEAKGYLRIADNGSKAKYLKITTRGIKAMHQSGRNRERV